MTLTGHKTRAVFDRYHIVSGADQVEAVRNLAELHGAHEQEPRRVVAIGEALQTRTGTVRAHSGRTRMPSPVQVAATLRAKVASLTIGNSSWCLEWLRQMDMLRRAWSASATLRR